MKTGEPRRPRTVCGLSARAWPRETLPSWRGTGGTAWATDLMEHQALDECSEKECDGIGVTVPGWLGVWRVGVLARKPNQVLEELRANKGRGTHHEVTSKGGRRVRKESRVLRSKSPPQASTSWAN